MLESVLIYVKGANAYIILFIWF